MEDCWIEKLRSRSCLNEAELYEICNQVTSTLVEERTVKFVASPVVIMNELGNSFSKILEHISLHEFEFGHTVMLGNETCRRTDALLIVQLLLVLQAKCSHKLTILKSHANNLTLIDKAWFYEACVREYKSSNEWRLIVDAFEYLVIECVIDEKVICMNPQAIKLPSKSSIISWGNEDWGMIISLVSAVKNSNYITHKNKDRDVNFYDFEIKNRIKILPGDTIHNVKKLVEYAPLVFYKLRNLDSIHTEDYQSSFDHTHFYQEITSLSFSNLLGINTSSNSGSLFYPTHDNKYLLKTISSSEFVLLRKLLPDYYKYLHSNPGSMMTRYHGLYKLVHESDQKIFFIVMNNLFPDSENIGERYDLKGSTSNRSVDSTSDPRLSYKDLDFVKRVGKIKLGADRSREFMAQLRRDCEFLCKHDILDYSLLLGISTSSLEGYSKHKLATSDGVTTYFTGIIDMLTQFNSKKRAEYFFKFFVYKDEMSCVPPNLYAERFLNFIESVLE